MTTTRHDWTLAEAREIHDLPLFDLVEAHGYQIGDLESPSETDNFFFFGYDWRQDNVVSVNLLAERLENLRKVRDVPELEIDLICQSNGSYICRYYAKYRAAQLEEAEAGQVADSAISIRSLLGS